MKSARLGNRELWYADSIRHTPCAVDQRHSESAGYIVLIHGFPLDHTMWAGQLDAVGQTSSAARCSAGQAGERSVGQTFLSATSADSPSLHLVAPDLRGFGRSPASGDKVTMETFADDLAAFLDAIGIKEPVVLCGLSMGGYIALQFVRKYADRLRGLVLCDTRSAADMPEIAAGRLAMAERVLREGPAPLAEAMLPKLFSEATRRERPELVDSVRRTILANDPRGIAAAARGMAERPDMTAMLGEIRCPTLVIVGRDDIISPPAEMRAIAEAIPGAQLAEIPDAGHMSPLENPAEFNAVLGGFISEQRELKS